MTEFPDLLVSPQWLATHLNHPSLVIVDCRFSLTNPELGQQQYQQGHLPGAFYLDLNRDLSSPVQAHGGRHPLPNPEHFAQTLSAIGITHSETFVVAYDDSRFAFAARLWWLLRYFGHEQVAILDGGWSQWQAQGHPLTLELPTPQPGKFNYQLQSERVVDIHTVKARQDQPGVVLVDARDRDRYLGKYEPIDPVAGHIPGSVNYPWQDATEESGFARLSKQKQRWQDLQTAQESSAEDAQESSKRSPEEIIVYCGSGVTACVNLWSLEVAGISHGKLYAGSWSDWCSYLGKT
ncbi:MAG: sulfurtransferase [Microcoleaceae cyanobacterium]